jgi:hypothetical protein
MILKFQGKKVLADLNELQTREAAANEKQYSVAAPYEASVKMLMQLLF